MFLLGGLMIAIKTVLRMLSEGIEWPTELKMGEEYRRLHDDHDGTCRGRISVIFSQDSDAWVSTDGQDFGALRFRGPFGGSSSPRVNVALRILALAIKLDSDERPDPEPRHDSEE